jgi:hypothetical protein
VSEYAAHVTAAANWTETKRLVVRVCTDGDGDQAPVLVELPLGLTWAHGRATDRPPAWEMLTRRADVALAENGWNRTGNWSHHVWPQPLARARVRPSEQLLDDQDRAESPAG